MGRQVLLIGEANLDALMNEALKDSVPKRKAIKQGFLRIGKYVANKLEIRELEAAMGEKLEEGLKDAAEILRNSRKGSAALRIHAAECSIIERYVPQAVFMETPWKDIEKIVGEENFATLEGVSKIPEIYEELLLRQIYSHASPHLRTAAVISERYLENAKRYLERRNFDVHAIKITV